MKRVLVTGATGFIGKFTLSFLIERGFEVHAVYNVSPPPKNNKITWHQANLLDCFQIENLLESLSATHLLHLAWEATPGKYWTSNNNVLWLQSSLGLLKSFHSHGGERVVIAGTCAEYDWSYGFCSENITPKKPNSLYGTCKLALHHVLESYSKQNKISSAWGHIFFLYGPHENPRRLVSYIINSLLKGEKAYCTSGMQWRDFLYVEDVANALVTLLDSDVTGSVNINSGEVRQVKDLVEKIAEKLNRKDLIEFSSFSQPGNESLFLIADSYRLFKEARWLPRFSLDEGLDQTIKWWRSILQNGSALK